jgi:hypothetical protein
MIILRSEGLLNVFGRDAKCQDIMYSLGIERLLDLSVRGDMKM